MHLTNLQILPIGFYLSIYDLVLPPDIKGSNARDIYPWLFERGNLERPYVLHIFSKLSVKNKASEISPKSMSQNC